MIFTSGLSIWNKKKHSSCDDAIKKAFHFYSKHVTFLALFWQISKPYSKQEGQIMHTILLLLPAPPPIFRLCGVSVNHSKFDPLLSILNRLIIFLILLYFNLQNPEIHCQTGEQSFVALLFANFDNMSDRGGTSDVKLPPHDGYQ